MPLALTAVALVSGIGVAATTFALVDRHVQANAEAESQRLAGRRLRLALPEPPLAPVLVASFPATDGVGP